MVIEVRKWFIKNNAMGIKIRIVKIKMFIEDVEELKK